MSGRCWELPSGEVVITPTRLADDLGVSRQTVYLWISKGLPVMRAKDGKMMVLYSEALGWLREQKGLGNIKFDSIPGVPEASSGSIWKVLTVVTAAGFTAYGVYRLLKKHFEGD